MVWVLVVVVVIIDSMLRSLHPAGPATTASPDGIKVISGHAAGRGEVGQRLMSVPLWSLEKSSGKPQIEQAF
jgi:hypothetical protein